MRRILILSTLSVAVLLLAACGNKGPLVRAPTQAASQPAPATSVDAAGSASTRP